MRSGSLFSPSLLPSLPQPCPPDLERQEGECVLDEQPHQPLRVENELVAAGFPVSAGGVIPQVREGGSPAPPCPEGGEEELT